MSVTFRNITEFLKERAPQFSEISQEILKRARKASEQGNGLISGGSLKEILGPAFYAFDYDLSCHPSRMIKHAEIARQETRRREKPR